MGKKLRLLTTIASLFVFSITLYGQQDVSTVINAGEDAGTLTEAYIEPFGNLVGAALNNGWYNTAKPHGLLGFDVTFTMNSVLVPEEDKNYDFSKLEMKKLRLIDPDGKTESPTMFGSTGNGPEVGVVVENPITNQDTVIGNFNLPPGLSFIVMPLPNVQAGIGLVKGTEVMIRFMPEYEIPGKTDGKITFYGFGLKHDVKQWIPVLDKAPVLNISILGAFTKFKFNKGFGTDYIMRPPEGSVYENGDPVVNTGYDNQGLKMEANAFTTNLIVSADLPIVTFYGSGGYNTSKVNTALTGKYPIPTSINNNGDLVIVDQKDIVDIESKEGYFQAKLGARLKMAVVTFHVDYTYSKYQALTGGIGISFR